jgi:murein DD-endopeptidase MepM/ murein hydrolase activator NlpD
LLAACVSLGVGCGSDESQGERFTAQEFVDAASANGAGLVLGEPLGQAGSEDQLYALRLAGPAPATDLPPGADAAHGGGTLKVTPSAEDAEAEYERCEGAASLVCFRAANIALIFKGITAGEQARVEAALLRLDEVPAAPSAPMATTEAETPAAAKAEPSAKALRLFDEAELKAYMSTGEKAGLDWAVIAAVDRLEGSGIAATERIPAIGLQLQGFGAPEDYRGALEAREGSSPRFAAEVLALADSLRAEPDLGEAGTVRRGFRLPVEGGTVVAGYGSRFGLVHDGIDIEAPEGEVISAAGPGVVSSVGFSELRGNQTCVVHRLSPPAEGRDSVQTCYGNQSQIAVEPGDVVDGGEEIGAVGCTGPCLRPHVHFRVLTGIGESAPATDPGPYLSADVGDVSRAGTPLD